MHEYCDRNNVPYRMMENFVRNIRKKGKRPLLRLGY